MTYCINPECQNPQNPHNLKHCQACGSSLHISEWLYRPIRPLNLKSRRTLQSNTWIYEVEDHRGKYKVMKAVRSTDSNSVSLMKREAIVLQSINHPGVPKCDADGCFSFTSSGSSELRCLVLEKIAGQNLEQWLQKHGPISQALALKWMRQLVEILEQVHQKGFLHRDIKPSNIILRPDGHLMLIDFEEGIVSAGYTPREQVDEDKAVPQSDFFALGRTFTHLLTGRHPVDLPKDSKTRRLIWRSEAPQVSEPLANLIDQLMDPLVDRRPQTAQQILQRLSQITEQPLLHRIERLETQTNSINQHLENIPAQITEISRIISERIEEIDCQLERAEQTSSQHIRGINSKVSRLRQWGALFGLLLSLLVGVLLWLSIQQETSPVVLTTPSQCLPNMKNDVNSLAFSLPKGKYLATTSLDTTARVWEMSNRSV